MLFTFYLQITCTSDHLKLFRFANVLICSISANYATEFYPEPERVFFKFYGRGEGSFVLQLRFIVAKTIDYRAEFNFDA